MLLFAAERCQGRMMVAHGERHSRRCVRPLPLHRHRIARPQSDDEDSLLKIPAYHLQKSLDVPAHEVPGSHEQSVQSQENHERWPYESEWSWIPSSWLVLHFLLETIVRVPHSLLSGKCSVVFSHLRYQKPMITNITDRKSTRLNS